MSRWSCHIMEVNLDSFCCPFHNCLFIFHLLNVAPGLLLLWRFVSSRTFCIFDSSWQWARTSVFSFSRHTGFPIGTTFFLECRFSSLEPSFRSTYLEHSFVSLFYFDVFSLTWLLCFSFRGTSFCALHHYSTLGGRNGLVLTGPERGAEFEPSASPLCRFGLPLWLRSLDSISQRCASFLSAP